MTAKVRIEFTRLAAPGDAGVELSNQPAEIVGVQVLTVVGVAQLSDAAPAFGQSSGNPIKHGAARVIALAGAVNIAWGDNPVATEAGGRVEPGAPLIVPLTMGQQVSVIQAVDAPSETTGSADNPNFTATASSKPLGAQFITNPVAAVGLTVPAGATRAVIMVEGSDVRWRDDGQDPTGTVGMLINAGQQGDYTGDLSAIRFINRTTGSSLSISYYGRA